MAPTVIRHVSFNHKQDCFALATDDGVRVFNTDPLAELAYIKSDVIGSIKLVAPLNRTNLIAMVSGNPRPKFSSNVIMIFDALGSEFVVELNLGGSPILNLMMTSERIIAAQSQYIHVFTSTFEHIRTEETAPNPQGIMDVSEDNRLEFLSYPGSKVGSVQLVNMQNASQHRSLAPSVIFAHRSKIARIALNSQATRVATGSIKGTVVKLFDTRTHDLIFELRRGVDNASLYCLRFSYDSEFLCVSSDKGTVHVFSLNDTDIGKATVEKLLDHMRFANNERRSAFQFSLPSGDLPFECAFVSNSITKNNGDQSSLLKDVVTIGYDGTYYRFSECSHKPIGYELLFDLVVNPDFWKVH